MYNGMKDVIHPMEYRRGVASKMEVLFYNPNINLAIISWKDKNNKENFGVIHKLHIINKTWSSGYYCGHRKDSLLIAFKVFSEIGLNRNHYDNDFSFNHLVNTYAPHCEGKKGAAYREVKAYNDDLELRGAVETNHVQNKPMDYETSYLALSIQGELLKNNPELFNVKNFEDSSRIYTGMVGMAQDFICSDYYLDQEADLYSRIAEFVSENEDLLVSKYLLPTENNNVVHDSLACNKNIADSQITTNVSISQTLS